MVFVESDANKPSRWAENNRGFEMKEIAHMGTNRRVFFMAGFMLLAGLILAGSIPSVSAQDVNQKRAFGTFTRGSTVCVGPLSPSSSVGVQIFGRTNSGSALTWQVFSVSSQSAPTLVFSKTAPSVSQTVPPKRQSLV
jgi:hypothetical protein